MTDVIASLFMVVHQSNAKLTWFRGRNYFLNASTLSAHSLRQMLLRVAAEASTSSLRNAVSDRQSFRYDLAFWGISGETNPNMRQQFDMSWLKLEVSKFLAASLEHCICHFGQYESTRMSHDNFLCKVGIVIPRLHCLFRMAEPVSSTVQLVNSVTSDSVNSFNLVMWAFASNCFPIELVPCSDGWRRTWWQMIHKIRVLPVSSIPQPKSNRHEDACLELFRSNRTLQAYIHWNPPSIEDDV